MRRAIVGLAVTAFALLALAGPASAGQQVTRIKFTGTTAVAQWFTTSGANETTTDIAVAKSKQGSSLFADKFTSNFSGSTQTVANVTSGFSFALKQPLQSAQLSASDLPAMRCRYGPYGNLIGCTPTTMSASAAWTGQGPITRYGRGTFHSKTDGVNFIVHENGTQRNAAASATVAGLTVTASDLSFPATLGTDNAIELCIGGSCP